MSKVRDALSNLPGAAFADLLESDDAYRILIDLPGATADTTQIRVKGRRVIIEAQRAKDVPADYTYEREDRSLFLDVEFPLPLDATSDGASASLDNGVLALTLPKSQVAGGQSIPIEDA